MLDSYIICSLYLNIKEGKSMSKNYSSFWFDDRQASLLILTVMLKSQNQNQRKTMLLLLVTRAIGNFASIVSGQNVPVKL